MTKYVLIAEDRDNWREMYVKAINRAFPEVQIDEVTSGAELLEKMLQREYTAVVSDNRMNDKIEGIDALRRVRATGNNVPFYLLSGDDIESEAKAAGVTRFYSKGSFSTRELVSDLTKYLE